MKEASNKASKERAFAIDHDSYKKWKEFKKFMYNLREMQNEGCIGCGGAPTNCKRCMQDYYWVNVKRYLWR